MNNRIRGIIFDPLLRGELKALVPDLTVDLAAGPVAAAALLSQDGEQFVFEMHFVRSGLPHEWPVIAGGIYARENCQTIRGRINGEIAFECRDVLPPSSIIQRNDGSSVVMLQSGCMNLISGVDEISSRRIHELLGLGSENDQKAGTSFHAHLIYHGPKERTDSKG